MEAVRSWIHLHLCRRELWEICCAAWDVAVEKKDRIAPFGLFGGTVLT